jgi:signal transduction histidine kinase
MPEPCLELGIWGLGFGIWDYAKPYNRTVRVPTRDAARVPMPKRPLVRILLVGAVGALLVTAGGWFLERTTVGTDEADARNRVEREVRQTFDVMARRLRDVSMAVAEPSLVRAAAADDTVAARRLFELAAAAIAADEATVDAALTVFAADGTPLAWAGRPSELPPSQLTRGETWFLSRLIIGPRLVYVRPVVDGSTLIGIVAAERAILPADRVAATGSGLRSANVPITLSTRVADVTIHLPNDAVPAAADSHSFGVTSPAETPLLTATVAAADLRVPGQQLRRATWSLSLMTFAAAMVLLAGPLVDWRNRARRTRDYAVATLLIAGIIVLARLIAREASLADWTESPLFSGAIYAGTTPYLWPLLPSPLDFLLTAAAAGGLVALLLFTVEAGRVSGWQHRRRVTTGSSQAAYLGVQLAAGILFAAVLVAHEALLRNTIANSTLDLLRLSLQEWDTGLMALQIGLVVAHATALGFGVAILRAALVRWSIARRDWRLRAATIGAWMLPLIVFRLRDRSPAEHLPLLVAAAAAVLLALFAPRLMARYRHGSQAFRLTLLTFGLVVPAAAFYPTIFQLAHQAKSQLVQTGYATQALEQRENVNAALDASLGQIDEFAGLVDLVSRPVASDESMSDRAYRLWQMTALANYPVTSSIELFGPDRRLVSRFAFNLPEDFSAIPQSEETSCDWAKYAEVNPFFAEERRILYSGRQLCAPGSGRQLGAIVVHVMLEDYENLPFIDSTSPYVELLRSPDARQRQGFAGRDVEYAVYGWSRTPLFASGDTAWPMPDAVFARVIESREAFWTEMRRGSTAYDVYVLNNRGGIYALGFPVVSALDHLVHLAELTVLAALTYMLLLAGNAIFGALSRRRTTAPALLREIRASFYRKLFIAFVAAVFLPVVLLAIVTRVYIADRMRTNIEEEAVRTASAAGRVVQDLVGPRAANPSVEIDDNLLVWVSRLVDQDVNMFSEGRLVATSERNLFASGFLPTRTPAEVHQALELRREAATVIRERVGTLNPYLVAGTRLSEQGILTVPLTARQQEIEQEIETLDRRVLLSALFFIFGGSLLGYWFAERISDPVNRLTRATRRIARGDLDARVAATSSDELRRLVEDFNSMAGDLQRQRAELERTNRLEAWAEMARQVAHEIKNPLTPIQLNAEHLRRVHADRGEPLGSVVQQCVATILTQVKLLRQIASEFSSFAGSPTARPSLVDVPELLHEIVDPYRAGLSERIRFEVDVPAELPAVHVDRTLISRSLTNIVENALHAMPGPGTLAVMARAEDHHVRIRVSDTGVGMDPDALARAFEPYFSTKATGTGLGLPIAKRNVELSGGTIAVSSERDRGTTVELRLPIDDEGLRPKA